MPTAHPARPPATPDLQRYSKLCRSKFFLRGTTASSSVGQTTGSRFLLPKGDTFSLLSPSASRGWCCGIPGIEAWLTSAAGIPSFVSRGRDTGPVAPTCLGKKKRMLGRCQEDIWRDECKVRNAGEATDRKGRRGCVSFALWITRKTGFGERERCAEGNIGEDGRHENCSGTLCAGGGIGFYWTLDAAARAEDCRCLAAPTPGPWEILRWPTRN